MVENNQSEIINNDTLEIHYWFIDDSHTMDAFIENRCEYELLGIIRELSKLYSLVIEVNTEPTAEGGLKKWFKIITKEENKKATITNAVIIALITVILISPISQISERLIDKIFEDKELQELEKEKLKLEIEKLKQETDKKNVSLESNNLIRKRKSNFYETLDNYSKIEKVSFAITNDYKLNFHEKTVLKDDFKKFILVSDDLEPEEIEDAIIEIVSPVLKKGKYKWVGIYQDESISFNMKSSEFKALVQRGEIEFKNGSSINCHLSIRRKINNEGEEKIVGFDVVRVNHYFQNNKAVETKEGKKHRGIKEAKDSQFNLFDIQDNTDSNI